MSHDAAAPRAARRRPGAALAAAVTAAVVVAVPVATAPLAALPAAASPPADVAPPPQGDRPTWALPTDGDVLAAFDRNGYNEQDGAPRVVPSPTSPGRQALEFRLDGGDQRSEVEPRVPDQSEGDVWFYTYRAGLAPDFPTDTESWQVVLQWHHTGDSGSPPIAVEVKQGRLALASEGEDLQDLGPIRGGDRIDLTMRVAFSQDPRRSSVDVWRDGRLVLEGHQPRDGTMLDDGNYLKVGLYRATAIDEGGRLWVDDLRVGTTMASVAPTTLGAAAGGDDPAAPAAAVHDPTHRDDDTVTWVAGVLLLGAVVLLTAARRGERVRR